MTSIAENAPDPWARAAARAPIAFSQVREDPLLDESVLAEVGPEARVFMIASGGDTAAALVASGKVSFLQMVDLNSAQIALARVKLHLLRHMAPERRLALLGHVPMEATARLQQIGRILEMEGWPNEISCPQAMAGDPGLDYAGRYEILFHHLREELGDHREALFSLCSLVDPGEQARRIAPDTALGEALDRAFDTVMRLENLVCLFGEGATRNARLTFGRHFALRTRHALATLPARTNPFLTQLLLGRFIDGAAYDWLHRSAPASWPRIDAVCAPAAAALADAAPGSFDFVHLSNILDWLSPAAAAETLSAAWRALRPGGRVAIRQLNSTLDIPASEPRFTWRSEAGACQKRDRSFFYRAFYIGEKADSA